jgi:hypothetical protein
MTASRIRLGLVGLALIFTAGCGGGYGKKLVGTWEASAPASAGKDNPFGDLGTITVEYKADGGLRMAIGPIEMNGTYKVIKEDGKVVTVEAEMTSGKMGDLKMDPKDKEGKKTFTITFEDDDTITMDPKDKPDPMKLKRKK